MHWTVERRYTEFYNLEAKLTAFHPMSEFEDAKLPPRPKLFSGKGLDVLQAKKRPFEEYLKCLLQKPSLKNSDILFTFLTSSEEFTEAATSHLGLAKMIKNVPMKLTKGPIRYDVRKKSFFTCPKIHATSHTNCMVCFWDNSPIQNPILWTS